MIPRTLDSQLKEAAQKYPLVALLGPRQSGKTTLAKSCFPNKPYVSLESPDSREFAQDDPRGFLNQFPDGAILDEIQKVPELFSYIQVISDKKNQNGYFILTGSQNYLLMEQISQSLAGRVALHTLLPFSQSEIKAQISDSVYDQIWKGSYPRVYEHNLDPLTWSENYIKTYVERDVRELKNISDLTTFHKFIKMCAGRSGQLVNFSSLADDCGITHNTAKAWLSVLETSYILFLLQPYHNNFNKRLVKSPKLYFYDTGLLCYLLGIQSANQIATHAQKGALFETYIMSELLKDKYNHKKHHSFYFWQDNARHEIDCLIENGPNLIPIEIKSGETFSKDYLKNFTFWNKLSVKSPHHYLVYAGSKPMQRNNIQITPWNEIHQIQMD